MHIKCPHCDSTVQTSTSVILWLDVIVCSCVAFVELSKTRTNECINKLSDCSVHYYIAEYLLINICVALLSLHGVKKKIPTLFFPYVVSKTILVILCLILFVIWTTGTDSIAVLHPLLPEQPDISHAISYFIILAFQFYAIFVMIWSYNETRRILNATTTKNKSFKSIVSIWIGDDSRTNMCNNDSTCIIDTSEISRS